MVVRPIAMAGVQAIATGRSKSFANPLRGRLLDFFE
jgi:hypothetical protein